METKTVECNGCHKRKTTFGVPEGWREFINTSDGDKTIYACPECRLRALENYIIDEVVPMINALKTIIGIDKKEGEKEE